MEQTHQRNERLIENKIWKYLLPGIMMSLALQLGNIVDTVFVGNFLGTEAMSAITLVLPPFNTGNRLLSWYGRIYCSRYFAWQAK